MTNHHISVPKADLVLAMNDLRLSGQYHSADLLKKALFSASVSAEPSDECTDSREQAKLDVITTWTDDDWNEVLSYADERTLESWRKAVRRYGAAPVSAVPVGEIVLFGGDSDLKEVSWQKGKMPPPGTKLYTTPVAAQAPVFSVGVRGVGLIDDNPSALAIYFYAAPNNDDIRALHEVVSGTPVAAQAQPEGVTLDGCLETLFRLGEYLGVDYAASRKSPGAPSDVYIKAIEEKGFKARDAALEEAAVAMEQTSRQGGAMVIRALKSGSEAQQPVSGADVAQGQGVTRADAQQVARIPAVDKALEVFFNEGTEGNAVALVRAIMAALAQISGNTEQLDHFAGIRKMVTSDQLQDVAQMIEPPSDAEGLIEKIEDLLRNYVDEPETPYRSYAERIAALAQQDADKVDVWQCTTTLQESDDLIWLYCQDTNTIDGPVKPNPEFIDAWTHWAWVTHPSTTAIDAARKEQT